MFKDKTVTSSGRVDTLIGAETTIEGKVQGAGILRVEGRIRGEVVTTGDVIIGEKGEVRASIKAKNVTIAGKVIGNILAEGRLHIHASGVLHGDVEVGKIMVEEGANFKGTCVMQSKDRKNEKSDPKVETPPDEPVGYNRPADIISP